MLDWAIIALAVISVPLALILGGISVAGLAIWATHKNKMAKLEIAEKERQAEMDRELLGLGSKEIGAHIETLLDRMRDAEDRLAKIEAIANIEAAKARGRIPITSGEQEQASQERRQQQTANDRR